MRKDLLASEVQVMQIIKVLRTCAVVLINTVIAIFGTAAIQSSLAQVYRPRIGLEVLYKEWVLSVIVAGTSGFFIRRFWRNAGVAFTWVLPLAAMLILGVFVGLPLGYGAAGLTGRDCAAQFRGPTCRFFSIFTLPLVRGLHTPLGLSWQLGC